MALPFGTPASLAPTFVVSCCEVGDMDAMADVYYDAFRTDPGNSHWWAPSREQMLVWNRKRISKKMADPEVRHFKITDVESGEVVAFARWDIPEGSTNFGEWLGVDKGALDVSSLVKSGQEPTGEQQTEEILARENILDLRPKKARVVPPEGADPVLARNFFDRLAGASQKWYKSDMLGLSLLCTHPKYHRRGAGKALLLPMLDIADAQGLKTYLEATPAGKPMYEKLGFREVDTLDWDLGKITQDLTGIYSLSVMIREPKPPQ